MDLSTDRSIPEELIAIFHNKLNQAIADLGSMIAMTSTKPGL
jgi:hypothetical protein